MFTKNYKDLTEDETKRLVCLLLDLALSQADVNRHVFELISTLVDELVSVELKKILYKSN